ncbi:MAG TPA: hypothetical protein VGK10_07535 [Prolixibacteraceae bacterium]|jgi:hypothetical protein
MKETSKKEEAYYKKWEITRERKWLYLLVNGSVYWGLPMTIGLFLVQTNFSIENMHLASFLKLLALFMAVGLAEGWRQFKRIDAIYVSLMDKQEIDKGMAALRLGEKWNYENLSIFKDADQTLTIQNQLLWLEDDDRDVEKLKETLNVVYEDYQRLEKHVNFEQFMGNQKVKIQLVDNSGKENLLMEKLIVKD